MCSQAARLDSLQGFTHGIRRACRIGPRLTSGLTGRGDQPSGLQTQDLTQTSPQNWLHLADRAAGEDDGAAVQAGDCPLSLQTIAQSSCTDKRLERGKSLHPSPLSLKYRIARSRFPIASFACPNNKLHLLHRRPRTFPLAWQ